MARGLRGGWKCCLGTETGWWWCSHAATHRQQQQVNYTHRRIRSIQHPYSKYSLVLSNWIVNYHFYFQFKKYHKGYTAPEMCCETKCLLLVVCALPPYLEADPCPGLLHRRQTEERCLFCSIPAEPWSALRAGKLLTCGYVPGKVTTCSSTGKAKLHFLSLFYLFMYVFS